MNNFDRSLPMMLYRTLDAVMPTFRRIFAEYNLTEQQWRVLRVLWEKDSQPLLRLSHGTLISSPSLVGVVDRLTRDGLVERKRSTTDRRVVNVSLTPKGRGLEEQVSSRVNLAYSDLEDTLKPRDWQHMFQLLDTLVAKHK
jgi:homoprotocatechuate degradation regulator HpaR